MSTWTELRDKLVGVAPTLATAVATGFGGPVAGAAVAALGRVLVGDEKASPETVNAALATATPDQIVAIKKADYDFYITMGAQRLEEIKAGFQDTANARAMQAAALAQDDLFSKRFVYYLAGMWSGFAMIYLSCITFMDIGQQNLRFADTTQGFMLGTVVAGILQYFFGSTRASHAKDETIAKLSSE